jgi:hypothetical protein
VYGHRLPGNRASATGFQHVHDAADHAIIDPMRSFAPTRQQRPESRFDSIETKKALVLAAIRDLSLSLRLLAGGFALGVNRQSHFLGNRERLADISIFRTAVERNQPIAMRTVGLKAVADSMRTFPEHLRAFRAFYSYFFVDHEMLHNLEAFCVCKV